MFQTVFRDIAGKPHLLGSDKLNIIELCPGRVEELFDMFDIGPVFRGVEIPHIGKDQAILIRGGKFLKDNVAQAVDSLWIEAAENLQHRLDHHVVVKQAESGNFGERLSYAHFSDGRISN